MVVNQNPGGKQEAPVISVSSSGLITATAGDETTTQQLPTQGSTTITPGTSQKTAVSSGRYTTGNVYVAGDSDLVASNIKSGVNIFGVTGTFEGESVETYTITNNVSGMSGPTQGEGGEIINFTGSVSDFSITTESMQEIPYFSEGSFLNKRVTFVMPSQNITINPAT